MLHDLGNNLKAFVSQRLVRSRDGQRRAAVEVRDADGLAAALTATLAPDRAAAMAAAAWDAMSDGAEVTDRVLEVLGELLDQARA